MRKGKKNQGIADVVGNFGFAFEVFKVIAHAVMAKGGTMEHLRRIVKEPALQRQIADLIVVGGAAAAADSNSRPGWVIKQERINKILNTTYEVASEYLEEIDFAELRQGYSANPDFTWSETEACSGEDIEYRLFEVESGAWTEQVVSVMSSEGCRPATYIELLVFDQKYPQLKMETDRSIVAIGSGSEESYPFVYERSDLVHLGSCKYDDIDGWSRDFLFLAVKVKKC